MDGIMVALAAVAMSMAEVMVMDIDMCEWSIADRFDKI